LNRKSLVSLAFIAVLLCAGIATVYFSEASINYSLDAYVYQKVGNQWYTATDYFNQSSLRINGTFTRIECQNSGLFDATFNIVIKLTNSTFSQKSLLLSQFVDSNTVKLSYNLHSQERTYTDLYFTVNNDAVGFVISMQFQTSQFLIRHTVTNWGGQSDFRYSSWENNTWAPAQIS
jgi:hypothetical protein